MAVWFGSLCKLRRWRQNSWKQLPTWRVMVLCRTELLHWYNGKCPCWTQFLSADCTTKIKFPPSENWNPIVFLLWPLLLLSFCTVMEYYICSAHHILRHLSIEPCYTLEHLYQSAIHTSWRKWLHIGECQLYPHVSLVEISCNFGSSLPKSAVNLTLTTFLHWGPGFIGNQGTLISFPNQFHIRI